MSDQLLIIPIYIRTKQHGELLFKCVDSLRKTVDNSVLIVDDCSPNEKQINILKKYFTNKYKDVDYIRKEENSGFSSTVNIGLRRAQEAGVDAVLINSDIEFIDYDWLDWMKKSQGDIVGARLLYPNRTIQHAGIYFSVFKRNFDHRFQGSPHNLPEALVACECPVTGALQYIRNEALDAVGLYDERFRLGFEDVDFNLRARKENLRTIYEPSVLAVHHESAFRRESSDKHKEWESESYKYLLKKYSEESFDGIPTMTEKNHE